MSKKLDAKKLMLQKLSKDLKDTSNKNIGEDLKKKKLSKVEVIAPDDKSLEKGLSLAEKLLQKKFGDKGLSKEDMEEETDGDDFHDDEESEEEEEAEECPYCKGKGCPECSEEEELAE